SAWDTSTRVNDDTGGANQLVPDVAIGPDGAAISVWWDYRATPGYDIYSSRRTPTTGAWGANQRVNDVATGDQFYPAVAIDGSNNAYAVWVDSRNGRRDIYFSKRSGTTGLWSPNTRVNTDTSFGDQTTPSIAVRPNGAAVAVWYRKVGNNKYHIYSARLAAGSTTWGPEIKVTSDTSAQKQGPRVTLGSDGTSYAVWMQPSVGNADVWFATLGPTASTWSSNVKISDDPGTAYQGQPDIGIDTAGNVTVAWDDWRATPNQLRVRRRSSGGAWAASTVIAADGANFPSVATRGDGRTYVVWYDGLNALYPNVWSSSFNPATGTWSIPEQVDVNGAQDGASSPAVALDVSRVVVIWQNATRLPSGGNDVDIFGRTRAP
ncbi:MAG TPA: hypothetical protein VFY18_04250, partial [Candidatus Limnocylindrales bacterium]|nr:hypothetical protein [Candidatus Limnocylindrales bacterium]